MDRNAWYQCPWLTQLQWLQWSITWVYASSFLPWRVLRFKLLLQSICVASVKPLATSTNIVFGACWTSCSPVILGQNLAKRRQNCNTSNFEWIYTKKLCRFWISPSKCSVCGGRPSKMRFHGNKSLKNNFLKIMFKAA